MFSKTCYSNVPHEPNTLVLYTCDFNNAIQYSAANHILYKDTGHVASFPLTFPPKLISIAQDTNQYLSPCNHNETPMGQERSHDKGLLVAGCMRVGLHDIDSFQLLQSNMFKQLR